MSDKVSLKVEGDQVRFERTRRDKQRRNSIVSFDRAIDCPLESGVAIVPISKSGDAHEREVNEFAIARRNHDSWATTQPNTVDSIASEVLAESRPAPHGTSIGVTSNDGLPYSIGNMSLHEDYVSDGILERLDTRGAAIGSHLLIRSDLMTAGDHAREYVLLHELAHAGHPRDRIYRFDEALLSDAEAVSKIDAIFSDIEKLETGKSNFDTTRNKHERYLENHPVAKDKVKGKLKKEKTSEKYNVKKKNSKWHSEYSASEYSVLLSKISEIRSLILSLSDKRAAERFFTKINIYAPYFTQLHNKDILKTSGKAAPERTCNVTSASMVLSALGVSAADCKYMGDDRLYYVYDYFLCNQKIKFSAWKEKFDSADTTRENLASLRFPDFLQLLAVALKLDVSNPGEKADLVLASAAHDVAHNINFLRSVIESFDKVSSPVTVGGIESPASREREINRWTEDFSKWRVDDLDKKTLTEMRQKADGEPDDATKKSLNNELRIAEENAKRKFVNSAPSSEDFRKLVIDRVYNEMLGGSQVLLNRPGHFVRLQSIDPDEVTGGIVIDDPYVEGKNFRESWVEARSKGYFRSYMIVSA